MDFLGFSDFFGFFGFSDFLGYSDFSGCFEVLRLSSVFSFDIRLISTYHHHFFSYELPHNFLRLLRGMYLKPLKAYHATESIDSQGLSYGSTHQSA